MALSNKQTNWHGKSFKPFTLTLFWRLFLSLLIMLLVTSALSVAIERWLNEKQLNGRMQFQVAHLVEARQNISHLIEIGDFDAIRQIYRLDRTLMGQVRLIDEQGNVVFPEFWHHKPPNGMQMPLPPVAKRSQQENTNRLKASDNAYKKVWRQVGATEASYPELADTNVRTPDGRLYTIQLQPRLPLHDVMALRRDYISIRIALIVLFSILVCYWFSHTLTHRIRKLQRAVHDISEGSYQNDTTLTELGDDELGMLAKDVAHLSSRLADSEKARRQMLSDISHELRSPLARLDIATELTRDFVPQAGSYLSRIEKESGRMNHLIDQIIHIQSLQMTDYSSKADDSELVEILPLLKSIKEDVCFEFQNKQVRWQWSPPLDDAALSQTNADTVFGNYEYLYSAFENVIRNAFEHTAENSTVTVAIQPTYLGRSSKAIQIDIMDMGTGIDDEADLERIFQPFVRLNASRSRQVDKSANVSAYEQKSRGYGLGLAIAHAIITAHNGQLSAHNRGDNDTTGLVVRVVLPLGGFDEKNRTLAVTTS